MQAARKVTVAIGTALVAVVLAGCAKSIDEIIMNPSDKD